jgi:hypothetical protein
MRFLGEMLGYKAEFQWCAPEPGGIGGREFKEVLPYYAIRLYSKNRTASARKPSRPTLLEYEGVTYLLSYVKQVAWVPYEGDVVNLSVEGSPTFQTAVGMSHNTKKPVPLMRWICRLLCPKDGLVLDPYCGSGSTLQAAVEEGMRFTGIELDPKFIKISESRMDIVLKKALVDQENRDVYSVMSDAMAEFDDD